MSGVRETDEEGEAQASQSERQAADRRQDTHLDALPEGCGCVEVWEVLSARRTDSGASAPSEGQTD